MLVVLNLALPWVILMVVGFLAPGTLDPQHWLLQGLQARSAIYGVPTFTYNLGVLGFYVPLAVLHNITYLFVRLVQDRMDLDFLSMIRTVLIWGGTALVGYWTWISFLHGAKFGEFHNWVLFFLPPLALLIGLGCFVHKEKGRGAAQITALLVAWAPIFSIVATLAGNHMRPPELFAEMTAEPGGGVKGWNELDPKTRSEAFLRLSVEKEGVPVQFPSLARGLKIDFSADHKASRIDSEMDPVNREDLLQFPEVLEDAGWRPTAANAQMLAQSCASPQSAPTQVEWVKSDAVLTLKVRNCGNKAQWSVHAHTTFFALGRIDTAQAARFRDQRQSAALAMNQVDTALLSHKDWRQRKLGLSLLAQVNDPATIPLLGHAFYDPDVEVRQTAAAALLSWGSKVEEFLSKALNDSNPYMRGDALRIVALAQRHQAHTASLRLLSDPHPYVRVSAVQALAPFVKDTPVLKTLMQVTEREYAKNSSDAFLKDPFNAELVLTLAQAKDVRTAPTLLKVFPKVVAEDAAARTTAENQAAEALRGMHNWMGVDYLQALVRRSTNLDTREKALLIMARWRENGDEAAYIKALQDDSLRPYALGLLKAFESEAVTAAAAQLSAEATPPPAAAPSPETSPTQQAR